MIRVNELSKTKHTPAARPPRPVDAFMQNPPLNIRPEFNLFNHSVMGLVLYLHSAASAPDRARSARRGSNALEEIASALSPRVDLSGVNLLLAITPLMRT